eukprot:7829514-Heterocapsa_arctica.AAC.1
MCEQLVVWADLVLKEIFELLETLASGIQGPQESQSTAEQCGDCSQLHRARALLERLRSTGVLSITDS